MQVISWFEKKHTFKLHWTYFLCENTPYQQQMVAAVQKNTPSYPNEML